MLIGITGRAGVGKDTLADAILADRNGVKLPFAEALRDVVEAAFGWRYETQEAKTEVDQWWEERIGRTDDPKRPTGGLGWRPVTGRRVLQFVGTELFRTHVHPDFWCFVMERRLLNLQRVGRADLVVIPDIRFDNEAALVHQHGGVVVHLRRPDLPAPVLDHDSERGIHPDLVDEMHTTRSIEETKTIAALIARRFCGVKGT